MTRNNLDDSGISVPCQENSTQCEIVLTQNFEDSDQSSLRVQHNWDSTVRTDDNLHMML